MVSVPGVNVCGDSPGDKRLMTSAFSPAILLIIDDIGGFDATKTGLVCCLTHPENNKNMKKTGSILKIINSSKIIKLLKRNNYITIEFCLEIRIIVLNYDWMIVGLGNPGEKYAGTRHNIGWMAAFGLCEKYSGKLKKGSSIYYYADLKIENQSVLLVVPTTFMNASGDAVRKLKEKYEINPFQIVVICDEYNFPLGKIHLRKGGNDGGHNGVTSVIEELGTMDFLRLRCGIGKNFPQGGMVNYVLSNFLPEEIEERNKMIVKTVDGLTYLMKFGIIRAMTDINSEKLWKKEEEN